MISYLGDFAEDATVYIMFNTFSSDDPSASCTITNFANTDVHIHKDDGLTQRNNAAGITVSVDFDGITGSHMVKIDTSDDTVGGFWVVGHEYFVRIEGTTIDGATINSVIGQFSIENRFKEVTVTSIAANTITAASINADAITEAKIADNAIAGEHLNATACTKIIDDFETQSQADPTGFHVNVKEVNGTAQTANDNSADINAILGDTNELQTDWVNGGRLDLILDIIAADTTTDIPATISTVQGNVTDILADTNELQGDWVNGGRLDLILDACALEATVAALNNISTADVNAQVSDVIKTDTIAEMAQGVPAATPTMEDAIMYLYMYFRNEVTQTSSTLSLKNDGGTVITKATVSDDATTFTKGEMVSGP
ncbi:MAG: hypothetical protein KAQ89_00415 [Planctomycetes bacterium]|nr:hypothetical protein [Planctomycetota bacterium]